MEIDQLVAKQRQYFRTGATKSYNSRLLALQKLQMMIKRKEVSILEALKKDLNKSELEGYMTEIGMVLDELRFVKNHLKCWMKRKYVPTPLAQLPSISFTQAEPYGVVLIMAPWNYPFQLCLEPVIGAIASGNCVILKPSAYAGHVSQVIEELISECFPEEFVSVVQGGRKENQDLLKQRFDYIFFTGGLEVGKLVMKAAAENLTPVSLELGGKSPCIIEKSADIKLAARRLAFGKFLNAGQTCVAPDYVLVQKCVQDSLLYYLEQSIKEFFGEDPLNCEELPKIINQRHYDRLIELIKEGKTYTGGHGNEKQLKIEPTVLINISTESKIMQEEIFGPILPIISFEKLPEAIEFVAVREKPLACYLFTGNKTVENKILSSLSFGGGCINDTIVHLATSYMGFGGVGNSGIGSYHGKASFETFSHRKSMLKKANFLDLPMRYHPYTEKKLNIIKKFLH